MRSGFCRVTSVGNEIGFGREMRDFQEQLVDDVIKRLRQKRELGFPRLPITSAADAGAAKFRQESEEKSGVVGEGLVVVEARILRVRKRSFEIKTS